MLLWKSVGKVKAIKQSGPLRLSWKSVGKVKAIKQSGPLRLLWKSVGKVKIIKQSGIEVITLSRTIKTFAAFFLENSR